jgi:hypothetical protein
VRSLTEGTPGTEGPPSTDNKGRYRISGLSADRYFVAAECDESLPVQRPLSKDWAAPRESWLPVFYPDSPDRSGAIFAGKDVGNRDWRFGISRDFEAKPNNGCVECGIQICLKAHRLSTIGGLLYGYL